MRSLRRQVLDHDVQAWASAFLADLERTGRPAQVPTAPVIRLPDGDDSAPEALDAALRTFARTPRILVASDFDGVLAPIVADRDAVQARPRSLAALRDLSEIPGVSVALVSGRALGDLDRQTKMPSSVVLVGSHGAEIGTLPSTMDAGMLDAASLSMNPERASLLASITRTLRTIATKYPGADVEVKPAAAVLHTRRARGRGAVNAAEAALEYARSLPEAKITPGKAVVEFSVVDSSKGVAIEALARACAADAWLYLGDDVTDETVFGRAGEHDVAIKVGAGDTAASYRVEGPEEAERVLRAVLDARREGSSS